MSLRTPLNDAKNHGSAHSGTMHFWFQRVTGIASVPLTLFLIILGIYLTGQSNEGIMATLKNPFVALGLIATVIVFAWHMKLGMQVIIEDYVHGKWAKYAGLLANIGFSVFIALVGIFSILKISFGA